MEAPGSTQTPTPSGQAKRETSTFWGGPFILGILVVALGILALIASGVAGLATILVFGVLFMAAGLVEIFFAFKNRKRSFLLPFLSGLLSLVVGFLFVTRPMAGLATASFLLAAFLFTSGLFRGLTSIVDRYPLWGWDFAYGVVAVLLGIGIFATWPASSIWVVGIVIGIELIIRGGSLIGMSIALREELHKPRATLPT